MQPLHLPAPASSFGCDCYFSDYEHTSGSKNKNTARRALSSTVAASNRAPPPDKNLPAAAADNAVVVAADPSSLPTKLIDFQTQAKIEGDESHVATIRLHPGETLRAEAGAMLFMTEGVVSKFSISLEQTKQNAHFDFVGTK